jgi:signal transduction histidine kinase
MGNKRSLSIIYNNLGIIYLDKNPQKAKKYINKTIQLKEELKLKDGIDIALKNLGNLYLKAGEYQKAIQYFKRAETQSNGRQLIAVYVGLKNSYKASNQLDLALKYSEKETFLTDSLLNTETQKEFLKIQTKYETEKKEREIVELKSKNREINYKRKMNNYLLYAVLGFFVITLLFIFSALKNVKRKRLLTQQNYTIKTKKLEKLLKDQELDGIDAILDAQEKERDRIANDLHDNLGSKIATLKLYIDEVSNKDVSEDKRNQLAERLKNLANETYKEIRSIAHHKKFGTFINKGLVPSIQAIANQISSSHKLAIKVINVNVDKHISNTIEIQIFRIVQELLTNCIKHASATEVIIQFSEYDNVLNVIVEDNGKGFDSTTNPLGYGLKNVKKRIEKIGGTLDIDATLGEGSTIILNIPL